MRAHSGAWCSVCIFVVISLNKESSGEACRQALKKQTSGKTVRSTTIQSRGKATSSLTNKAKSRENTAVYIHSTRMHVCVWAKLVDDASGRKERMVPPRKKLLNRRWGGSEGNPFHPSKVKWCLLVSANSCWLEGFPQQKLPKVREKLPIQSEWCLLVAFFLVSMYSSKANFFFRTAALPGSDYSAVVAPLRGEDVLQDPGIPFPRENNLLTERVVVCTQQQQQQAVVHDKNNNQLGLQAVSSCILSLLPEKKGCFVRRSGHRLN